MNTATKETWQVILSGVGGQGLMLAGNLLGKAALYEGKKAVMTSAYGVETRGTFTKSDVIISGAEIDFPEVGQADAVIALDVIAYKKYADSLGEESLLIYDDSIDYLPSKAGQAGFPVSKIAKETGNPSASNIAALGILVKLTGIVAEESIRNAIREEFKDKEAAAKQNLAAFEASLTYCK